GFLFQVTAASAVYTLSLHDALPILGICVNPVSIFCLEKLFISFLSFQHLIQLLVYIKPAICKMIFLVKAIHSYLMLFCVMISAQDRKSTRLNSSHVSISYAVFCLKK